MDKFVVRTKRQPEASGSNTGPIPEEPASSKRQKLDSETVSKMPRNVVSWNCNSIKVRTERKDLKPLVEYMNNVDVDMLFLQETRLKPEDQVLCEHNMKQAGLQGYRFFWNTHRTKRYSGTACIVRQCCVPQRVVYNYADLVNKEVQYERFAGFEDPDTESRVIILEYHHVFIINVYTPMATWYDAGQAKRSVWDARFRSLVTSLQLQKPVVVVGDLNVCHQPLDVSHPSFFATAKKPGNVGGVQAGELGQPGFTQSERDRFSQLLEECKLVDTFRSAHPETPRLTWGFSSSYEVGIYRGKYMGLDYVLVSQSLWDSGLITKSEVCGANHCFGSDHCCIMAEFDWLKAGTGREKTEPAMPEALGVQEQAACGSDEDGYDTP